MIDSGVRSSCATSAIRSRRSFSCAASRVVMLLKARATIRRKGGPRSTIFVE